MAIYFLDMDGVLTQLDEYIAENMYRPRYFVDDTLPNPKMIKFAKELLESGAEVYILTKTPGNHPTCAEEKLEWLEKFFPEFPQDRVIVQPGELPVSKAEYIHTKIDGLKESKVPLILIDDYTKNCVEWQSHGPRYIAFKALNGKNGLSGKWEKEGGLSIKTH